MLVENYVGEKIKPVVEELEPGFFGVIVRNASDISMLSLVFDRQQAEELRDRLNEALNSPESSESWTTEEIMAREG